MQLNEIFEYKKPLFPIENFIELFVSLMIKSNFELKDAQITIQNCQLNIAEHGFRWNKKIYKYVRKITGESSEYTAKTLQLL